MVATQFHELKAEMNKMRDLERYSVGLKKCICVKSEIQKVCVRVPVVPRIPVIDTQLFDSLTVVIFF